MVPGAAGQAQDPGGGVADPDGVSQHRRGRLPSRLLSLPVVDRRRQFRLGERFLGVLHVPRVEFLPEASCYHSDSPRAGRGACGDLPYSEAEGWDWNVGCGREESGVVSPHGGRAAVDLPGEFGLSSRARGSGWQAGRTDP